MSWMAGWRGSDAARKGDLRDLVAAFDRSQAMIEFMPDGTIVTANDNFLKALGYSLDEIKGQHHRMFVEPAERNSAAYREFWAKLGRGEFDAGQYKRVGKGGKEIWIQASYNPVLDAAGKTRKVVKLAADITAAKAAEIAKEMEWRGQIEALSRSQAMIEFTLDGIIVNANQNFLVTLGYTLEEIRGKHHGMFVDPEYRSSPQYRAFWDTLGRGEFDTGQYKRIGKGGKEVWIQASYNPVLDTNGKPCKVVKLATDITLAKQAEQAIEAEVGSIVEAALDGDLTARIASEGKSGFMLALTNAINGLCGNFASTLGDIKAVALEVTNASAEISASTTDLSQRTEEQAASLEQTSASMEEISATVKKNAENAQEANRSADTTRQVADRGGQVVAKAVEAMARIEQSAGKISDIIGVIDEIARQTNLLALNAAVEAARAGEAGRGFAVVASEVRSLAQRSSQAAKDIKDLITNSNGQVKDGVDLVNKAGTALSEIVGSIKKVADLVADIAHASGEQAGGIEQVNKALSQMDEVTQQNSALVEQNAATAKTLEHQAHAMNERVAAFRIGDGETASSQARRPRPVANVKAAPMAARPQSPVGAAGRANGIGAVPRMQAAVAAALSDPEWQEF
jgi:methyl-accepting chemotaxis protein